MPFEIVFDADFSEIITPSGAGTGTPIRNTFFYSATAEGGTYGIPRGNDYRPENLSRIVTSPRWLDQYAFRQTIDYRHDYRSFNGGLQKPRSALLMDHPEARIETGEEHWIGFAFFLPTDFIFETNSGNPDNIFQFKRSTGSKPKTIGDIILVQDRIEWHSAWVGGVKSGTLPVITFPATRGVWHRFAIHIKPALVGDSSGFYKIYKDGSATPFYDEDGPNTDQVDDHKLDFNLYKYAWWSKATGGSNKTYPGSGDARADWEWLIAQNPKPNPTNDTGQRSIYWGYIKIGRGSGGSAADVSPNWVAGDGGGFPEITGFNNGNALTSSANQVRFTAANDDFQGAYKFRIIDSLGYEEEFDFIASQELSGRLDVGDISALTSGAATLEIDYVPPGYHSETSTDSMRDWALFNVVDDAGDVPAYDNGGDFTLTYGQNLSVRIENSGATQGLINMKAGAPRVSASNGDIVTARVLLSPDGSDLVRFRVQNDSNQKVTVTGQLGVGFSFTETETGVTDSHVIREFSSGGFHILEIEFEANTGSAEEYYIKLGSNSGSAGADILGHKAELWANREANKQTISHQITIDTPNTSVPAIDECEITKTGYGSALSGCVTDTPNGQAFLMITDALGAAPDSDDMENGTAPTGALVLDHQVIDVTSLSIQFTTLNLDPFVDWRAFIFQKNSDGTGSIILQSESDVEKLVDDGLTRKIKWGAGYDGAGTDNRVFKNGTPFNGTLKCRCMSDTSLYPSIAAAPQFLFYDGNVVFVNGAAQVTEADIEAGSVNQLTAGDWVWVDLWQQPEANINGITLGNPTIINATAHGFETGDKVFHVEIVGTTELNGEEYPITRINADSYSIPVDSTGFTSYVELGRALGEYSEIASDRYKVIAE